MRPSRLAAALLLAGSALLAGCAGTAVREDGADTTGELGEVQKESPADLYVKLAVEYLKTGQTETALRKIKTGLAADSGNAQAHNVIAIIYQRLGELGLAEKHFLEAVRLQPKDPYIRNAWGGYLCDRGRHEEAQEHFEKALENPLYPTPEVALTNAAVCAQRAGDTGKADELFMRALSANPRFAPALYRKADMDYRLGRHSAARAYLERYFKVAAPTPQALLLAARVERKLGSRKRASAYEQMLRKKFPDAPEILYLSHS